MNNLILVGVTGAENTIIDCGRQCRCLSVISGATGVRISGIQFRNGRRGIDMEKTNHRNKKRNLPIRRVSSGETYHIMSVQYYLASTGKIYRKTTTSNKKKHTRALKKRGGLDRTSGGGSVGGCILVGGGSSVQMNDVIVTQCEAIRGSGLAVLDSSIQISECKFHANGIQDDESVAAVASGGGAYISNSSLMVSNSSFSSNFLLHSNYAYGGGLFVESSHYAHFQGPISCSENLLSTPSNGTFSGSGLYMSNSNFASFFGLLRVSGNEIRSAHSDYNLNGGGMAFDGCENLTLSGDIFITHNSMTNNDGKGYLLGGGILFGNSNYVLLQGRVVISNNSLYSMGNGGEVIGGAIYGNNGNHFSIVGQPFIAENNVLFSGASNIALYGAGLYFETYGSILLQGPVDICHNRMTYYAPSIPTLSDDANNVLSGGGIHLIGSYSIFFVGPFNLSHNTVKATGKSLLYGGGASIAYSNDVVFSGNIVVSDNTLAAYGSGSCNGGGLHLESLTGYLTGESLAITSNLILADSSSSSFGGGLHVSSGYHLSMMNVNISNNLAQNGGAMWAKASNISATSCTFLRNTATNAGGVLFLSDDTSATFANSAIYGNVAPAASLLFANVLNSDYIIFRNPNPIPVNVGNDIIMLGGFDDSTTAFVCIQPGTVFARTDLSQFFSLDCLPCDPGTYAVEAASTQLANRKCKSCPFGGRCLGSSPTSNGLYALTDYWGTQDSNGTVNFSLCPSGYCCPLNADCEFDHCEGNRIGVLCGQCAPGYGMRFFSNACGANAECNHLVWFVWIIIFCSIVVVVFLLVTTGRDSSGMLSIVLYFYQTLPLIKSTNWKYTYPAILVFLQSAANFSPTGDSTNSPGICIMQSMTAARKLSLRMFTQAVVFGALALVFIVHKSVFRHSSRNRANVARYIATAVRFCSIAYLTLVLVPLQMLQCVYIPTGWVWWLDGSVECMQHWQRGAMIAVASLAPLPFGVIVLLVAKWKNQQAVQDSEWKLQVWKVLTNGFRTEMRWWLGISLYRRFLLVLCFTMITDSNWRAMALATLCLLFFLINTVFSPFKSQASNHAETASLLTLAVLAITTIPQLAQLQFATSQVIFQEDKLEWIQFTLAVTPLSICTVRYIIGTWNYAKTRLNRSGSAKDDYWIDEEFCNACSQLSIGCPNHQYC